MSDNSRIEWTDATWNPITGCKVVSPGCSHCYAMRLAGTRLRHHPSRIDLTMDTKAGPVWTGMVRLNEQWIDQPMRWKRPRRIFVCAHGDLFAQGVPDDWIDQVFRVMALCPHHTFQVLTKRAARMLDYVSRAESSVRDAVKYDTIAESLRWPLPNVWLGVSVEDQRRADERILPLLQTPAAVRWLSCEPLLDEVTVFSIDGPVDVYRGQRSPINWIVAGGESGPRARPMHPEWARSLRDQCVSFGVPFFFKQWGEFVSVSEVDGPGEHFTFSDGATVRRVGKKVAGRRLDGVEHNGMPL